MGINLNLFINDTYVRNWQINFNWINHSRFNHYLIFTIINGTTFLLKLLFNLFYFDWPLFVYKNFIFCIKILIIFEFLFIFILKIIKYKIFKFFLYDWIFKFIKCYLLFSNLVSLHYSIWKYKVNIESTKWIWIRIWIN